MIPEMLDLFKGVDIIVHNVGGSSAPSGGFATVTDELWQQAINENLFPAVRLDRGLLPSMIERASGVIVHVELRVPMPVVLLAEPQRRICSTAQTKSSSRAHDLRRVHQ